MPRTRHKAFGAGGEGPGGGPGRDGAIPLSMTSAGQEVVLAEVAAGRRFQHRLAEMGLTRGTRFSIVAKGALGPYIILVKDTRLMLGRGMVDRIFVRPA